MANLADVLRTEHQLSTIEIELDLRIDESSLPMAGTTYYYNNDPATKKHKHLATSM